VEMIQKAHSACSRRTLAALGPFLFLVVTCFFVTIPVFAQVSDTGTISGSVTDPSGAVVPHVVVTITNTGTAIHKSFPTDNNGTFVASALPYGNYVVSVAAPGFATTTSQSIILTVGATVNVNLGLTVATAAETIVIT
jgi:hypothetical protein